MNAAIVLLPGDGIGPEVVAVARRMLELIADRFGHRFSIEECAIGGGAIDTYQTPLPEDTLAACMNADAVLLGAVGGPKWDDPNAKTRPEQGLLDLRKQMELFANLRPIQPHVDLLAASPLRPEKLNGVDFIVVRELTGGIYFGQPRHRQVVDGQTQAVDTMAYTQEEIGRVARLAFDLANRRSKHLTSIDKANVLETSRLWRETIIQVSSDYPQVTLDHLLVDAAAMHLLTRPASFDVLLTANLFGDILTDEASVLTGSMGNLPSASIGNGLNSRSYPRGLYEPIHGSAPDIAGQGIANPIGAVLSTALLLRHSLGLEAEATAVETAVDRTLAAGHRTSDLTESGKPILNTQQMSDALEEALLSTPTPERKLQ